MAVVTADVVICGAGLAGISAAYFLARSGQAPANARVLLVDERPPLTLTSDKSSECYRNWWPGFSADHETKPASSAMVRLMNRSIDLMEGLAEESGNVFRLNRRGYLYVTGDPQRAAAMRREAKTISALGAGPLRCHMGEAPAGGELPYEPPSATGFAGGPPGADFIGDPELLHHYFPYLTHQAVAALHVRRAGWLSAQQLGMHLLDEARARGVELVRGRVTAVTTNGGRVDGVVVGSASSGEVMIATPCFVDAAGPYVRQVAGLLGLDLPVFTELHAKVSFNDTRAVVPRDAPLLIWNDAQRLSWTPEEAAELQGSADATWMLEELPPGAHMRPEGGPGSQTVLLLWPYHTPPVAVTPSPTFDPNYTEVTLRGLSTLLPALHSYVQRLPTARIDGGYYVKTRENRPLICPLPLAGAYLVGALSGFGVMAACAAGELLAAQVSRAPLPDYAPAFSLERYRDPSYLALLERSNAVASGQL